MVRYKGRNHVTVGNKVVIWDQFFLNVRYKHCIITNKFHYVFKGLEAFVKIFHFVSN